MSRYFSEKFKTLTPYVPGEQPRDRSYIKLNTNESPFSPSPKAQAYAAKAAENLQLYSDPTCTALKEKLAQQNGLKPNQVFCGNGSDEVLYFAFLAYCDSRTPAAFADITYGFYKVFAEFTNINYKQIPLNAQYAIQPEDYFDLDSTIFIANPNAPTGKLLTLEQIETILQNNPNHVVVIDEAYIDFGGESSVKLVNTYDNLLVTQTFSKSRSLAGGRLGMAFGNEKLIQDLETVKFSVNPYNVNTVTMMAGIGALEDEAYTRENCRKIMDNRSFATQQLEKRGFTVLDSKANFIFAGHPEVSGETLYKALKDASILVRYFAAPRLSGFVRITIGTEEQMQALLCALDKILEELL